MIPSMLVMVSAMQHTATNSNISPLSVVGVRPPLSPLSPPRPCAPPRRQHHSEHALDRIVDAPK